MSLRRLLTLGAATIFAAGLSPALADAPAGCVAPTVSADGRAYGSCNSADAGAAFILDGAIPTLEPGVPPIVASAVDNLYPGWMGVDKPPLVDTVLSQGVRDVAPSCGFATVKPSAAQTLLLVGGVGLATGRGRATLTEITCEVYTAGGTKVFGLTRGESGPVAPLGGTVALPGGAGGLTLCAAGEAKFDDGQRVKSPKACVSPS